MAFIRKRAKRAEQSITGEGSYIRLKKRIVPAALGGITLSMLVLLLEYFKTDAIYGYGISLVIFASFAGSIFIMFIMPNSRAAKVGKFVKSYILAGIVGYFGSLAVGILPLFLISGIVLFALTVLLILTDSEHPPAAAIAFAFVLFHVGILGILIIFLCIAIILLFRYILEKSIFDLERKVKKIEKARLK